MSNSWVSMISFSAGFLAISIAVLIKMDRLETKTEKLSNKIQQQANIPYIIPATQTSQETEHLQNISHKIEELTQIMLKTQTFNKSNPSTNEQKPTIATLEPSNTQLTELNETVKQALKKLEDRAENKNITEATNAYEMGKKEANSNHELARVYYLNAINHMPNNYEFLETYTNHILNKTSNISVDDLSQNRTILEVALYQVPAEKVKNVLQLIERINQIQEQQLINETKKSDIKINDSIVKEAKELLAINITNLDINDEQLKNKLTRLQELHKTFSESSDAKNLIMQESIEKELTKTYLLIDTLTKLELLQNSLTNIQKNFDTNSLDAVNPSLQSANSLASQIWANNFENLPEGVFRKAQELSTKIKDYEKTYIRRFSAINAQKISNLITIDFENVKNGYTSTTNKIKNTAEIIKKINAEMLAINDLEARNSLSAMIEQRVISKISEWEKERLQKYQLAALTRIKNAFNTYNSYKVVTNYDATAIFDQNRLSGIKQELLISETSIIYNDILNKLYAEMDADVRAKYLIRCATDTKLTLEDF